MSSANYSNGRSNKELALSFTTPKIEVKKGVEPFYIDPLTVAIDILCSQQSYGSILQHHGGTMQANHLRHGISHGICSMVHHSDGVYGESPYKRSGGNCDFELKLYECEGFLGTK